MKKQLFLLILLILITTYSYSQSFDINGDYKISGKLGIGTYDPKGMIHLLGDSHRLIFTSQTSNLEDESRIEFWETSDPTNSNESHFTIQYDGLHDVLRFRGKKGAADLDHDFFSISRNSYIGIGTFNPQRKFHIQSAVTTGIFDSYTTSLVEDQDARLQLVSTDEGSNGSALILTNQNKHWSIHQKTFSSGNRLDIGFRESSQQEDIAGLQSIKMTLLTSGYLGLGEINPRAKVQIKGDSERIVFLANNSNVENTARIEFWETDDPINSANAHFAIQYDGYNDMLRFRGKKDAENIDFDYLAIKRDGTVGIGTTSPAYKLDVCGTIRAKEVKVDLQGSCGADFVFKSDYKLMNLKDLEGFVKTNKHLPEIASEKEMIENGINMKEFQMKLLQKIEELTLYLIEQNKQIEEQNKRISELEKQNIGLKLINEKIGILNEIMTEKATTHNRRLPLGH